MAPAASRVRCGGLTCIAAPSEEGGEEARRRALSKRHAVNGSARHARQHSYVSNTCALAAEGMFEARVDMTMLHTTRGPAAGRAKKKSR